MITVDKENKPVSFQGRKAVDVFRIRVLISSLGLLAAGISPTRGLSKKRALVLATEYTGKVYKRTEIEKAIGDLKKIEWNRLNHIKIKQGEGL